MTVCARRILVAESHREAYRYRAEHLGIAALADRATAAETTAVIENIVNLLQPGPEDRVLDIGSGDGQFLARAALRQASCTALDITSQALSRIRQQLGPGQGIGFVAGISETLPFRDAYFSIIVINSVMHLLSSREEAARTVREIHRVLRPGGTAYFGEIPTRDEAVVPGGSRSAWGRLLAKLRRHGLRGLLRKLVQRGGDPVWILAPDQCLFWPREQFESVLRAAGFVVREAQPHHTLHGVTSRLNYVAVRAPAENPGAN